MPLTGSANQNCWQQQRLLNPQRSEVKQVAGSHRVFPGEQAQTLTGESACGCGVEVLLSGEMTISSEAAAHHILLCRGRRSSWGFCSTLFLLSAGGGSCSVSDHVWHWLCLDTLQGGGRAPGPPAPPSSWAHSWLWASTAGWHVEEGQRAGEEEQHAEEGQHAAAALSGSAFARRWQQRSQGSQLGFCRQELSRDALGCAVWSNLHRAAHLGRTRFLFFHPWFHGRSLSCAGAWWEVVAHPHWGCACTRALHCIACEATYLHIAEVGAGSALCPSQNYWLCEDAKRSPLWQLLYGASGRCLGPCTRRVQRDRAMGTAAFLPTVLFLCPRCPLFSQCLRLQGLLVLLRGEIKYFDFVF